MSSALVRAVDVSDHIRGNPDAPVTLLEYGDFECPHCGRAFPLIERVLSRLGERVRFVYRHFPITESHPHAQQAAEAAESVAVHGGNEAFWAMHDAMFRNQQALDDDSLVRYAGEAGVEPGAVRTDIETGRWNDRVREDFMSGVRSGVNGTPTLFIGGVRYDGPRDEEALVAALEAMAAGERS